ncbi:L-lactate permease [Streptomyces luteolus]|uniref:L-lactate permease n=1 Tax=Streptomyces luteolus TaxID=3043615 RepID=A0ABT6T7S1_9ACTN|nr:L-lactate permease [Streptomyces sp. B-S-A12]MDI3423948.1 L-lactate permease [Streptomyces sp. B-S-A12]
MNALLATLPVLATLGLLAAKVRALYAALAALGTAAVLTATTFRTPLADLGEAQLHMLPTLVELAAILFGGILLSELMSRTGAQARLGARLSGACSSHSRAVMLIVFGVTPFAESLTGFGIGVVVAIPLLRQLGLAPAKAAVVGLLGLVTVPWGSLAPGSLVSAELGQVDFQELGVVSALLSAPVFLICGAAALAVAHGPRRALGAAGELLLATGTLWFTVWAVNTYIGVPLAGVLGGLATIAVLLLVSRLQEQGREQAEPVGRALAPYAFLVLGLLAGRAALSAAGIEEGWWTVLAGPAGWLLLTAALTPRLLGADGTEGAALPTAVTTATARWWQVTLTTALFLILGTLLTVTGMSREIAEACAALGPAYLLLAPWIGAVGGFLAGSNTGANAMFAASQSGAAHALGYPALQLVGVQNVSAALASGGSVARVLLAAELATNSPGPQATSPAPEQQPSPTGGGQGGTATATDTAVRTEAPATAVRTEAPATAVRTEESAPAPVNTGHVLRTVLATHTVAFLVLGVIALLWR